MSFRESKGNMYPWVTHTWNVIKGKCPHDCSYCYMKRFPQNELRLDEKEISKRSGIDRAQLVRSWVKEKIRLLVEKEVSS